MKARKAKVGALKLTSFVARCAVTGRLLRDGDGKIVTIETYTAKSAGHAFKARGLSGFRVQAR